MLTLLKSEINQGVFAGRSPPLGWSPSHYHLCYCTRIWHSKILTGQEFGSKKFLPERNLALTYVTTQAEHFRP